MAEKASPWAIINGVLGAVAAVVTAATGLYLAMRDSGPPPPTPQPQPVAPAEAFSSGVDYARTPWLGVELSQDDRPVRLSSHDAVWQEFTAKVAPGPFELVFSRRADDPPLGILAWHDESIFECVRDGTLHLPGTGIAGAQFAVPILYLNREGFNYYDTERLKRLDEGRYAAFISTIGSGELELPLTRFTGPLYLIVFRCPDDFSMTVPARDFELIVLRRD